MILDITAMNMMNSTLIVFNCLNSSGNLFQIIIMIYNIVLLVANCVATAEGNRIECKLHLNQSDFNI